MARNITRVVNLYAIHARTGEHLLDYEGFFRHLATLPSAETAIPITREINFALADARIEDEIFSARVISGSPGEVPLYFDYMTGQTESGTTPEGKWLARMSRIVVLTRQDHRALALEANGSGVTASRLEVYFRRLAAETGWQDNLTVDLPPVPAPSLREEIASFERIREASAVVTRPNFDWSEFDTKLADLADESDGHTAEAVVKAERGKSLNFKGGIIGIILGSLEALNPTLKGFRVTGRKRGSDKEVTVSSKKHNQRSFYQTDLAAPVAEADEKMLETARGLMESTPSRLLETPTENF